MTDKKLTDNLSNKSSILSNGLSDNEIIKALEYWIKNYEGTFGNFRTLGLALYLINRQQNEKEYYKKSRDEYIDKNLFIAKQCDELQAENERLCQINGTLLSDGSKIFQEIKIVKAENERLEKENKHYAELEQGCYVTGVKNIKAEAYKEFAERLKHIIMWSPKNHISITAKDIDNLLKELVGEDK